MRIIGIKHITFPNGDPGLHIAAGPGMLRRIRRLVKKHGVTVEAISKRGKVIAAGIPERSWHPSHVYLMWGGVGRQVPKRSSFSKPNSGAPRSSSWRA